MKKISTIVLLCFAFISLTQAQTNKQFTLLTKKTADWCPKCGTWGWTFVKDGLVELENENVIFWAMHKSGGLSTPTSIEVSDNFDGGGQPIFYINQDDLNVLSGNVPAKIVEAKQTIQALNGFPAPIRVSVTPTLSGNEISATARVVFDEGTETDYNISMFLIRDKLVANQASVGQNAVHPFILDEAFYDNVWGPLINDGNAQNAGDEFEFVQSITNVTPHTSNIGDMKVAAIVWYNINGEYTFINGDIQSVEIASNSKEIETFDFTHIVYGNQLELIFNEDLSANADLQIYNTNGQLLPLNEVNIVGNKITATFNTMPAGAYIVNVKDQLKGGSRKIYIVE